MAKVAGIEIEKDSKGLPAYARINLKKHGEALKPFLNGIGAIEKTPFEIAFEKGLSGSELKERLHNHFEKLFKTPPVNVKK